MCGEGGKGEDKAEQEEWKNAL